MWQVFKEMKAHSEKDPQCVANVITYSALMTACCSGGRPDKAHDVFQDMVASGIKPDQISYSTLIAGKSSSICFYYLSKQGSLFPLPH